jgi:hypothetical protein
MKVHLGLVQRAVRPGLGCQGLEHGLWRYLVEHLLLGFIEKRDLVVQCTLAHEGETARLIIGAELADAVHGLLDGFVGDAGHGEVLLPVLEEGDSGAQRSGWR